MRNPAQVSANSEPFLLGHAQSPEWEKATEQCLQQIGYIPPAANLGFIYITDNYGPYTSDILQHLREETGIEHWTGTVGLGICANGKEYYSIGAMAIMISTIAVDSFRMLPSVQRLHDMQLAGMETWLQESANHLAVVHGDPRNPEIPEMVEQLADLMPGGYVIGGLSSSQSEANYPQIADSHSSGGLSGVLFNAETPILTALTQGCTPIATKHVITACERNIIAELDHQPALQVFKEDIGEILARDIHRAAGYIFAGLPIASSDTGDYLVRNLVGFDPEQGLLAIGDLVEPGQPLQFCRRDGKAAWEDMERMLEELKTRLQGRQPRGALYYSCLGRGRELFGDNSEELRAIRQKLGEFPLVGFFANGEISHNRLYGYTGVLTLFL